VSTFIYGIILTLLGDGGRFPVTPGLSGLARHLL